MKNLNVFLLLATVSKYPVGYVLTWRHVYRPKAASQGNPFLEDFMNFYHSPHTLFQKDIQKEDIYN